MPKDGPSAGVTMVTALASLLTGRPVRADVGMTGEVTLNGRVLPIGGVKQKLLAAQRAGLTEVFLPERNEPDLDDVPEAVREQLDVRLVTDVADLVREALEPAQRSLVALSPLPHGCSGRCHHGTPGPPATGHPRPARTRLDPSRRRGRALVWGGSCWAGHLAEGLAGHC